MALVTRCPNCATAFRVTPQHLQMQGGNVRCGHCSQVFNSFAALTTVKESETDNFTFLFLSVAPSLPAPLRGAS